MEQRYHKKRSVIDLYVEAVWNDDFVVETDVLIYDNYSPSNENFVKEITEMLCDAAQKVGNGWLSSLRLVLYSAMFDMKVKKLNIHGVGDCRRIANAQEM